MPHVGDHLLGAARDRADLVAALSEHRGQGIKEYCLIVAQNQSHRDLPDTGSRASEIAPFTIGVNAGWRNLTSGEPNRIPARVAFSSQHLGCGHAELIASPPACLKPSAPDA
jgi:hypothetical protein